MKQILALVALVMFLGFAKGQDKMFALPEFGENTKSSRIVWSDDATMLAIANGLDLAVCDVKSRKKLWQMRHLDWRIIWPNFAFSPDGKYLAVAVIDKTLVLDAKTGKLVKELSRSGDTGISWRGDDLWLMTKRSYVLYDAKKFEFKEGAQNFFLNRVIGVEENKGETLVVLGRDGTDLATVYSVKASKSKLTVFRREKGNFLAYHAGKTLFQAKKGDYEVRSLVENEKLGNFSLDGEEDENFGFSSCGNYIAIGGSSGKVRLYHFTGKEKLVINYGKGFAKREEGGHWVTAFAVSHGAEYLAIGGSDGVKIYTVK